jgi:MerR family transcriptional regulator, redox-sensitive transcriptional activator SoxR
MNSFPEALTIGDVELASGRTASCIRYYERIGLITVPERVSGRRRYPRAILRTLAIIGTAQRAGLTLDEIRLLLAAAPGDAAVSEHLRQVAARKLPEVRALIERTELVRRWLEAAAGCSCPSLHDCQLFDEPSRLPA